jgi:hypothetical protein
MELIQEHNYLQTTHPTQECNPSLNQITRQA